MVLTYIGKVNMIADKIYHIDHALLRYITINKV